MSSELGALSRVLPHFRHEHHSIHLHSRIAAAALAFLNAQIPLFKPYAAVAHAHIDT